MMFFDDSGRFELDVVALGELLIDFAPVSTNAAGYPTLAAQPGGAPGNFLAALQTYGCTAALIGKVGPTALATCSAPPWPEKASTPAASCPTRPCSQRWLL